MRLSATGVPLALAILAGGCSRPVPAVDPAVAAAHRREVESWHQERLERLTSATGWLTLAGLFWLRPGENRVGSDPGLEVALPESGGTPRRVGSLMVDNDVVTLQARPGAGVTVDDKEVDGPRLMKADSQGDPTIARLGAVRFYVIERHGRLGVRVKDENSRARRHFSGIPRYPVDYAWRLEGRLEPYDPPRQLAVPNVLGRDTKERSPGTLRFAVRGEIHRLVAIGEPEDEELFVVFADETNRKETYGAGRFLAVKPNEQGDVVIDFNRAYTPPCAFTPYATCPLPPRDNRLSLSVAAGEMHAGDH